MKRFVRRIAASLFIRLFLTLLAALLPFVAALSAVTLAQLNAHLVRSQIDEMDLHLTRATQYVNQYVQTLKSILMQMAYDPAMQNESPSAVRDALQRYADNAALHISQLYLRMPDGKILCTEQVIFDTMDYQPPRLGGNRAERIWISGPYFSRLAQEQAVALVLALPLDAGGTAELVCEVNLRMLMRNIQATLGKYPSFALLTLDDQLITYNINALRPDSNVTYFNVRMDNALLAQLRRVKLGQRSLDATLDGAQAEVQTSMGLVDGTQWKLIVIIRGDVLRTQIRLAMRSLLGPFFWGLPALLLLCAFIARGYTRPIRALSRQMDKAVSLAVAPPVAVLGERADEMGKLSRSYIRMLTRLADLQSREQEAQATRNRLELRLLQSQIYPHFYGNTLGCIVLLLLGNRQEQALDALRQLIRILSYGA
ncbi:MAG TPA: histidine kinase, partial [Clostridia bacterium]|nr:histidine kinase [Clostridia bacterium]